MSKIIILRGNSGSGKSTVGKALQKKIGRGTLLIGQDTIRREMLWVSDEPKNQAIDLIINLVSYGHQNCKFVILEGILYADIYEALFRKVEELFAENIFAYYFLLPFEETLKRHKLRPKLYEFGEAEMRRWWRDKDYLVNIHEKKLYKEMNLNEIVELIYKDITE
ncbi:kinase [Anaeropeptidivorans aminofermentans]|uniref:kinase n=1 Tax=Anaeropeptidivorans aminofermentans TaxID=2934315 RepID=UPI0020244ADA|nr:kinase [Anaeropeptidivorans aminofermentans]